MFEMLKWRVRNLVTIKDINIDLTAAPITMIRGLNKDKRGLNDDSRNGVGKTLLFSSMGNLRFDRPAVAIRKRAASDLIDPGTSLTLTARQYGHTRIMRQWGKPSGAIGYRLAEDGKEIVFRKTEDAKERIAEWWPTTEAHFYSNQYVSPLRTSPLFHGTGPIRHDFFENIFDLGVYDIIHKAMSKEYNARADATETYNRIVEQRRDLGQRKFNLTAGKERMRKLDMRYGQLSSRLEKINTELQDLIVYCTLAQEITSTASPQLLRDQRQELKHQLDNFVAYRRYLDQRLNQRATVLPTARQRFLLELQLRSMSPLPKSADALDKEAAKIRQALDALRQRRKQYQQQLPVRQAWKAKAAKLIKLYGSHILQQTLATAQQELAKQQSRLEEARELVGNLRAMHQAGRANCPTCGSLIPEDILVTNIATARERVVSAKASIQMAQPVCDLLDEKREFLETVHWTEDDEIKYHRLLRQLRPTERAAEMRRRYEILHERYRGMPSLIFTDYPSQDPQQLETSIDKLKDKIRQIDNDLRLFDRLAELQSDYTNLVAAQERRKQLERYIEVNGPLITRLHETIASLTASLSEAQAWQKQVDKLEDEIEKLEHHGKHLDIYGALVEAYSSKGMRTLHVAALAKSYVQRLNRYANLLYSEPFKFELAIDKNQFDILAHRAKQVSDIRYLGGQEHRAFLALSCLALLPFLPPYLRCNCVFLDEIESSMSAADRYMYATEFLPQMTSFVPHIFVITPEAPENFMVPNARELLLVKHRGITTLHQ